VTWRKFWTATLTAALFITISGVTPVAAGPDKAMMLIALQNDQSRVHAWQAQVAGMGFLGIQRTAILGDLSSASNALAALYTQTASDTFPSALTADSHQIAITHSKLQSLEVVKIAMASRANVAYSDGDLVARGIQLSGGLNASSPMHAQALAMRGQLTNAKGKLDQGVGLLGQATLNNYTLGSLGQARSLIDQAVALLLALNQQVRHLPLQGAAQPRYQEQFNLNVDFSSLSQLRTTVFTDPNLNDGERGNLLTQINGELIAFGRLNRCIALLGINACGAELGTLNQLDPRLMILPKAHLMLTSAADRVAVARLTALASTLQLAISAASAHRDVSNLNSLLSDLQTQVAAANTDIAPIDSELEPMTVFPPSHRSHDLQAMQSALAALTDADAHLTTARSDAGQLLATLS
jgi:hypothetical protein